MSYITESAGRRSYMDNSERERERDYLEEPREGILRNDAPRGSYSLVRNSRDTLRNEEPMAERHLRKEYTPHFSPIINSHMKLDPEHTLGWSKTHFIIAIDSGCTFLI